MLFQRERLLQFIQMHARKEPNIDQLARLFAVQSIETDPQTILNIINNSRDLSIDEIVPAALLSEMSEQEAIETQRYHLDLLFAQSEKIFTYSSDDGNDVEILDDNEYDFSLIKHGYYDSNYIEFRNTYQDMLNFYDRFADSTSVLLADESYPKLTLEQIREFITWPIWSFEQFAAYSMGYNLPADPIHHPGLIKRVELMEQANLLPVGHREHLPKISTPRDLLDWAVQGERFKIHEPVLLHLNTPSRDQLLERLVEITAKNDELEKQLMRKSSSGPTKENDSLRKLCIGLVSCIRRPPIRNQKSLYQPSSTRSEFVTQLQDWMSEVLVTDDVPSADTLRHHIRVSYDHLSLPSKKAWTSQ